MTGAVHFQHDAADGLARVVLDHPGKLNAIARHAATLSPRAARSNKRTLRQLASGGPSAVERRAHFGCAASAEHREGVQGFIDKRPAIFRP